MKFANLDDLDNLPRKYTQPKRKKKEEQQKQDEWKQRQLEEEEKRKNCGFFNWKKSDNIVTLR